MKFLFFLSALLFMQYSFAQSLGPYVIASTGHKLQNENITIYGSLGEPLNTIIGDNGESISQGVLQSIFNFSEDISSTLDILNSDLIGIFPNPASESVSINFLTKSPGQKTVLFLDSQGVTSMHVSLSHSHQDIVDLSVAHFLPGLYIVVIQSSEGVVSKKLILQ